jgi:putative ABC transport system substrate-binding protein
MSYGVDFADQIRIAAGLVGQILNGAIPADLPVRRSTKFRFVINLRTAKQLGLSVPQHLVARADEVIE